MPESDSEIPIRKRRRKTINDDLYSNFHLTGKHYITSKGKHHPNIPECICNFCDQAYQSGRLAQPPTPMNRIRQVCEKHLAKCEHAHHIDIPTTQSIASAVRPYDPVEAAAATGVECGIGDSVVEDINKLYPELKTLRASRNDNLFSHFMTTNEPYITASGTEHIHIHKCVCKYCADVFVGGVSKEKTAPKSNLRSKKFCEGHLKVCKYAPRGLFDDTNVDMEAGTGLDSNKKALVSKSKSPSASDKNKTTFPQDGAHELVLKEKNALKKAVVDFIVDADLPMGFVDRPSFRQLIGSIRPRAIRCIPSGNDDILLFRATGVSKEISVRISTAAAEGRFIGLVFDGIRSIGSDRGHVIKVTTGKNAFDYDCISSEPDSSAVVLARNLERTMVKYIEAPHEMCLSYVCTVNTNQQQKARQILSLRHPRMIFNPCFSGQTNQLFRLLLCDMNVQSCVTSICCMASTISLQDGWASKLLDKVYLTYGTNITLCAIHCVHEQRWSSIHDSLCSFLRIKTACKAFAISHQTDEGFPSIFLEWGSDDFWEQAEETQMNLSGLAEVSVSSHSDGNTMADKVHSYVLLNERFHSNLVMLEYLNHFWMQEEHHLLFLTFTLHPKYRKASLAFLDESESKRGNWSDDRNSLSRARVQHAAKFYYKKFKLYMTTDPEDQRKEELKLSSRIIKWLKGKSLEGVDEPAEGWASVTDAVAFWLPHETEHGAFVRLAKFLLCAPIQSSSCDDLVLNSTSFLPQSVRKMPAAVFKNRMLVKNANRFQLPKMELVSPTEHDILNELSASMMEEEHRAPDTSKFVARDAAECVGPTAEEAESWVSSLMASTSVLETSEVSQGAGTPPANDGDASDEDDPEKSVGDLEAIPDTEDHLVAKEDETYFCSKNYVRTDKLLLKDLVAGSVEAPALPNGSSGDLNDGNALFHV